MSLGAALVPDKDTLLFLPQECQAASGKAKFTRSTVSKRLYRTKNRRVYPAGPSAGTSPAARLRGSYPVHRQQTVLSVGNPKGGQSAGRARREEGAGS
jgi:hypothetical protein